jgi:hypothetical protein
MVWTRRADNPLELLGEGVTPSSRERPLQGLHHRLVSDLGLVTKSSPQMVMFA